MNSQAIAPIEHPQIVALKQIASQATPKDEIRLRKGRGGTFKYTDGAYVIRTLNQAFGWDWDFIVDNEELLLNNGVPFEVKVRGTLTVRLNGQAVVKTQFGSQPIEMMKDGSAPVSIGDCYKGAATDAIKKCASLLGIALDLYDSDSDVNTGKIPPPPPPIKQHIADAREKHHPTEEPPRDRLKAKLRELQMTQVQARNFLKNCNLDRPELGTVAKVIEDLLPNEAEQALAALAQDS